MARSLLTPERLTRYSYPHSQGSQRVQPLILHYVWRNFGIEPALNGGKETVDSYARYLRGAAATGSHVDLGLYHSAAFHSLSYLRLEMQRPTIYEYMPEDYLAREIATSLLSHETQLLNPHQPYLQESAGITQENLNARIARRIAEGKLSFLYFYGRDRNPTEFAEFDQMYEDIWSQVESLDDAKDSYTAALVTRHAAAVAAIEQAANQSNGQPPG